MPTTTTVRQLRPTEVGLGGVDGERHLHSVAPLASPYVRVAKPGMDRLGGVALTVATAPVLLAALCVVRVLLGPGVLLRQPRVGKDGRVFPMYKVRTMRHDRRLNQLPYEGPERRYSHKRADDPRHTTLGRFLRKWSIDELPQFWNVARGDMSLVGPRPELVSVVDAHDLWDHPRHRVRPGITGPWQISELRKRPLHENMHVDVEYVDDLSLRNDLTVIRDTFAALRTGRGS